MSSPGRQRGGESRLLRPGCVTGLSPPRPAPLLLLDPLFIVRREPSSPVASLLWGHGYLHRGRHTQKVISFRPESDIRRAKPGSWPAIPPTWTAPRVWARLTVPIWSQKSAGLQTGGAPCRVPAARPSRVSRSGDSRSAWRERVEQMDHSDGGCELAEAGAIARSAPVWPPRRPAGFRSVALYYEIRGP